MKKAVYILTLLIAFTSCSDNEDIPKNEVLNLEGEWKVTKYEVKEGVRKSTTNGLITSQSTFSSYAKDINSTYIFTTIPNELTTSKASFIEVITRTENGVSNQLEIPSQIEKESFSWELVSDILKVKNQTKNLESKLITISKDEIIIVLQENISLGSNSSKIEVSSKKYTTLKKI